jgi:hypothetical protein
VNEPGGLGERGPGPDLGFKSGAEKVLLESQGRAFVLPTGRQGQDAKRRGLWEA